jgi:predicted HicB family RNase H-like nuclease
MINNTLEYQGYIAQLNFDWQDNIIVGEVINTRAIISFHADSIPEIKQAFEDMVDTYIEACNAEGISPSRPYSGKFNVRITPDLHRELSMKAAHSGISLNDLTIQLLESGLHGSHHPGL